MLNGGFLTELPYRLRLFQQKNKRQVSIFTTFNLADFQERFSFCFLSDHSSSSSSSSFSIFSFSLVIRSRNNI